MTAVSRDGLERAVKITYRVNAPAPGTYFLKMSAALFGHRGRTLTSRTFEIRPR